MSHIDDVSMDKILPFEMGLFGGNKINEIYVLKYVLKIVDSG